MSVLEKVVETKDPSGFLEGIEPDSVVPGAFQPTQAALEGMTKSLKSCILSNGMTFYYKEVTAGDMCVVSEHQDNPMRANLAVLSRVLRKPDGSRRFDCSRKDAIAQLERWPASVVNELTTVSDLFNISADPVGDAKGN